MMARLRSSSVEAMPRILVSGGVATAEAIYYGFPNLEARIIVEKAKKCKIDCGKRNLIV